MLIMDVIADYLKQEGVTTLFSYPTTPIIEAAAAVGIRPVLCRQERVGVDMAHGFARVKNGKEFGVFAMQYGPGAENAFSGVATAYSDSAPILLLPLGHARDVAQTFPMFSSARSFAAITKSVEQVNLPGEIPHIMRRAISALKTGRLGPVMVEVPTDVVTAEAGEQKHAYRPVRATRSSGDERDVQDAARLLIEAAHPVIQAGQGVLYAQASAELVELAELLDVPVTTSVEGKSAFPENHRLSLGCNGLVLTGHGRHFIRKADLVVGIGTSLTRHFLVNPILPYEKKFIHVTNDARDLYKGYEMDVAILGDAKLVLRQLVDAVRDQLGKRSREDRVSAEIASVRAQWMTHWNTRLTSTEVPITPYRAIAEFMRVIPPEDAIVTHDSGSPRDQIIPFYQANTPNSYLGWGKSHALGTGLGLTIGAKVAAPDKFCVNFMGDAAFGMTGLDFETAARCGIPILTVVFNNSIMAVEIDQMKLSHERFNTISIGGNYANIAKDLGGWSEKVTDPEQLGAAFLRARRATENGQAALLEIITGPETEFSFRKVSLQEA
ncbi:MAG: thiamine pyrophosphate-requiring protein [Burkholderiales bacterium]|nr:MAG: thiamine pyrophosphate-requiring protein [Burkholderiales bacterium]